MANGRPDVVITGVALTSGLAADAEETWTLLRKGQSGVHDLGEALPAEFELPTRIGASLREDVSAGLNRVELRRLSFLQQLSLTLSRRAWESCGAPEIDSTRLGVAIGTGFGTPEEIVLAYYRMKEKGLKAVSPLYVQMFMPNGAAATVGLEFHAKAGVTAPLAGDASGATAVASAWQQLTLGEADVMICGGVEGRIESVPIATFAQLDGVLATGDGDPAAACRPFDEHRTGMVFGEGGAILVLETEDHARARGATILARLMGASMNSDAYDPIASDPEGERAAYGIGRALEHAGLTAADIGHVNAHAAGTVDGDLAEAAALRTAFGGANPVVYASKAALGHTYGSAGAIETALTAFALRDGVVPPTLNLENPDPRIDLDVVTGAERTTDLRYAVSTTLGFGGHNIALVLGRY
jgi:beta-ketoacyl ACP synthase